MKRVIPLLFIAVFAVSLLNCAGSRTREPKKITKFEQRIGRVTQLDFVNKSRRVLINRYQFQIERQEISEGHLYLETLWAFRSPFQDELDSGVTEARTKLILTAYPRELTNPSGLWIARMQALNEVRLEGAQSWMTMPLTPQAIKYFKKILDDLRIEYQAGIREF